MNRRQQDPPPGEPEPVTYGQVGIAVLVVCVVVVIVLLAVNIAGALHVVRLLN